LVPTAIDSGCQVLSYHDRRLELVYFHMTDRQVKSH